MTGWSVGTLGDYRAACLSSKDGVDPSAGKQPVELAIRQLEEANAEVGTKLGFTDVALKESGMENLKVSELKNKWTALQQVDQNPSSKPASDQYDGLVSDVRGFIGHAGDTSNLTLDPEMDSYYLADATSVTTVQSLNRIGSAIVALEPILRNGPSTAATRTQAAVFSAMLKESDFDRITGDIDTALKENAKSPRGQTPTLKATIEPVAARYKTDRKSVV